MGLNNRPDMDPRLLIQAHRPLSAFETVTMKIVRPNSSTLGYDYDPWSNNFTNPSTFVWQGQAQVQVFRQTLNTFMPVGQISQIRSIRFTTTDDSVPAGIRKGDQIRISAAENNQDLLKYQFTITSTITGDLAFTHDYEAEADMGVTIEDPVAGGGYGTSGYGSGGYGV